MSIELVQRSLGTRYPKDNDELLQQYQKVIGPLIEEMRARFNKLNLQVGINILEDAATISAFDTTGMLANSMMIDSDLGDVYSLQAGTPGPGDLQATPAGFLWAYEYTL